MWKHPFWFLLTMTVVIWYCSVTIYVGIRGALDIRQMLRNLSAQQRRQKDSADERLRS